MSMGFSNRGFLGYNKDLFMKGGLNGPTEQWTWDDLVIAAKKLTKDTNGDGKTDIWGFGASGLWVDLIYSAGGGLFNEKKTKLALDTPEAMKALQWWADLTLKYNFVPTGGEVNAYQRSVCAMLQSHPQGLVAFTSAAKPKFDAGTALFPKNPDTGYRRFPYDGNMISISGNSKRPKECWEFLKWFNTKDAAPKFFRKAMGTLQLVPPLKSVATSAAYLEPDRTKLPASFDMQVFVDDVDKYTIPDEIVRYRTDINAAISNQWAGVATKRYSVAQFVERVTKEANGILSRK